MSDPTDPTRADGAARAELEMEREARRDAEAVAKRALRELEEMRGASGDAGSRNLPEVDHDLRTPLNVILGLTESLLTTDLSDTQRDQLLTVLESGEQLLCVVEDLLDLLQLRDGRIDIERVEIDLPKLLARVLRPLASRARARGVELMYLIDPELPRTWSGDARRLERVIGTLATEAVERTAHGEIVVRVEQEMAGVDASLRFTVRDTRNIEEDAAQADEADAPGRSHAGHGLEWALCSELVARMGGALHTARNGDGAHIARFSARFEPIATAGARDPDAAQVLHGTRVLIAPGSPTQGGILDALVRSFGAKPVLADTAAEAFALLQEALQADDPFRLVVIDTATPDADGFTLAQRIRRDTRHSQVDLVFLAPDDAGIDPVRIEALLGRRVAKPVDPDPLRRAMERFLGVESDEDEGLAPPDAEAPPPAEDAGAVRLLLADGHEVRLGRDGREVYVPERKILLVEDSVANQKAARAMLREGHDVVAVSNGLRALELLAEKKFDVALVDIELPGMSGLELAAAIRAREAGTDRHLPLIAMTAHALEGDRERCLDAGMDDYIAKPVRRDALRAAIERAVGADAAGGGAPGADDPIPLELIDWTGPHARVGGNRARLRELVAQSLAEIREHRERLADDVARGDNDEVRRRARSLRAVARSFGVVTSHRLAQELEDAEPSDFEAQRVLVDGVLNSFTPVVAELERFVEREAG